MKSEFKNSNREREKKLFNRTKCAETADIGKFCFPHFIEREDFENNGRFLFRK